MSLKHSKKLTIQPIKTESTNQEIKTEIITKKEEAVSPIINQIKYDDDVKVE